MTPEALSKRLYALEKKVRQKQILYSATALAGNADCCRIFGIDYSTGDLYYRNADGDWALATSGGGGGGGGGLQDAISSDNILTTNNIIEIDNNILDMIAGTVDFTGQTSNIHIEPSTAYLWAQENDTSLYSEISVQGSEGAILQTGDGVNETTMVVSPTSVNISKDGGPPLEVVTSVNDNTADIAGNVTITTLYSGDDALTSDRSVELDNHNLSFSNSGSTLINLNGTSWVSYIKATDFTSISELDLIANTSGIVNFDLHSTNGVNTVGIVGDPVADSITYTTASHSFVGNIAATDYGSGTITGTPTFALAVDASGNFIETGLGGGGNTIYTANDSLLSNRTVTLNGKTLNFEEDPGNGKTQFYLDPVTGSALLLAGDGLGKTSYLTADSGSVDILMSATNSTCTAVLDLNGSASAYFNLAVSDGSDNTSITGDGIAKSINYTASSHSLHILDPSYNAVTAFAGTTNVRAFDNTGDGNYANLDLGTSSTFAQSAITAIFNDGVNSASVTTYADATLKRIVLTGVAEYANNAAASAALGVGAVYYTNSGGDAILKMVI